MLKFLTEIMELIHLHNVHLFFYFFFYLALNKLMTNKGIFVIYVWVVIAVCKLKVLYFL